MGGTTTQDTAAHGTATQDGPAPDKTAQAAAAPRATPLQALHEELGARLTAFAGWSLPLQYPAGVMAEHLGTRAGAGLFDVSHMGQISLPGPEADRALETVCPADLVGLTEGRQRYGLITTQGGGILDDMMVARRAGGLFVVCNAANARAVMDVLGPLGAERITDRALIALQGPQAEAALAPHAPEAAGMRFLDHRVVESAFGALWISRSGYTGEDGFEISVPAPQAEALARALLAADGVIPAGLGARDALRLEAGMPLHGADIGPETTPAAAGLVFAIGKARRPGGARAGGFPGAEAILAELAEGPARCRVGLLPEGRAPMRAGTPLFEDETAEAPCGAITSGGFAPSLGRPISMGHVPAAASRPGTALWAELRGKRLPVTVTALPFRPPTYKR